MEKQEIIFGHKGNGICVWTSCFTSRDKCNPDYSAWISPERKVRYNQDNTPEYFRKEVESAAKHLNFPVGNEGCKYFALSLLSKPTKYCDTKFYGRFLLHEEICGDTKFLCTENRAIVNWKNLRDYDPDKNGAVYFIIGRFGKGAYRCYGYSFSEETANAELPYFTKQYCDIGYDIQVEHHDEKFLLQCGEKAGVNLDFED